MYYDHCAGYEVATHRTQTDQCWTAPATDRFYFDPTVGTAQEPGQSINVTSVMMFIYHEIVFNAKIYAISSDTQQLQFIKLHHFKQERF